MEPTGSLNAESNKEDRMNREFPRSGPQISRMGADQEGQCNEEMIHRELSHQILGAAMHVLNELKPGLDEKIYENALVIALRERGLQIDQQKRFPVYYCNQLVGTLIPDLIVESKVIVDPKVVSEFGEDHLAQMLGYLAITGLELSLLLNFKFARLHWKRVVRSTGRNRTV